MRKAFRRTFESWLIFLYSLSPILVPVPVFAKAKGTVDFVLEWHTGGQKYTYVFTGVVSSQGRPCSHAKIQLLLSTAGQQDVVKETVTSADGSYELEVAVAGNPEASANWKLVAHAMEFSREKAEVEGRSILPDSSETVVVQRPIQLVQG